MDRTRRWMLATVGVAAGSLGGCLRLTSDEGDPTQPDTSAAPSNDRVTPAPDGTPDSEDGTSSSAATTTISCEATAQPVAGSERFTHPFGDSRNSFAVPDRSVPAEQPCVAWTRPLSVQTNRAFTGPVVTGQHVVSYRAGLLRARSRTDGRVAWEGADTAAGSIDGLQPIGMPSGNILVYGQNERTDDLVLFTLDDAGDAVASEVVYPASGPNEVRARTGRAVGDRVYIVVGDRANDETRVIAYDWPSRTVLWDESIGSAALRTEDMGADEDTIVITSDESSDGEDNVWALASDDGSVRWSFRLPIGEAVPVLDDDRVYLPVKAYDSDSTENQVRAVSKATGDTVWRFEVLNPPRTGVSVDGDRVYLVADNELYAVDPATGTPEWRFTPDREPGIGGDASSLPIVCQDTVLLGSSFADEVPARVRALNKETGELRWSFGVDGRGVQSPIPVDGALYAAVERESGEDVQSVLYSFY